MAMDVADLQAAFSYEPRTGELRWKRAPHPRFKVGQLAGKLTHRHTRMVEFRGRSLLVHRVIWALMTGEWPPDGLLIDHKNGDASDNRWENLRLATPTQNCANTRLRRGKVLPKGVTTHRKNGRIAGYRAHISANGVKSYLGIFPTAEAAHVEYCRAAKAAFGEFMRAA